MFTNKAFPHRSYQFCTSTYTFHEISGMFGANFTMIKACNHIFIPSCRLRTWISVLSTVRSHQWIRKEHRYMGTPNNHCKCRGKMDVVFLPHLLIRWYTKKKCYFSWATLNSDCSIARLCWVNLIERKHWSVEQILLCCALSSLLSILKRWRISANRKNKFLVLSNPLDYCRMMWALPLSELRTC